VSGQFSLIGNRITGFDDPGSAALALSPGPGGRVPRSTYLGNTFERCACPVRETQAGLWDAAVTDGNLFLGCASTPGPGGTAVKHDGGAPVAPPPAR
jgi:hypothetical protein